MSDPGGSAGDATILMHPEAVPGNAESLRWRITAKRRPAPGEVSSAPGGLDELLASGVLARVVVDGTDVVTTLGRGGSWKVTGPRVRTALHTALRTPQDWVTVPPGAAVPEVTVDAIEAVLAGPAGETIRRHGGAVRVLGVRDGVADLELAGACAGCPAAGLTIATTLKAVLRDQLGVRDVRVTDAPRQPFVALAGMLRRPRP